MRSGKEPAGGYRGLSLWHDQLVSSGADELRPREPLDGSPRDVDVCVVGAGYTGLWTAYSLLKAQPDLSVLVLEAEVAGFGASGRNGGWCSALFPASVGALAAAHGRGPALALRRAMNATVSLIGEVAATEGIDCGFRQGGTLTLLRSQPQVHRGRAEVAEDAQFDGVDGYTFLDAEQAQARVGADGVLGAVYTPHCARLQPAALVRGLARAVERLGGQIAELTPARTIVPGSGGPGGTGPRVITDRGIVRAGHVVRATEAYTPRLPGHRRAIAPVYSLMVATEPLPPSFWDGAGLADGETFADGRHLIVYGQRTSDDRLAFGGRGAPYHFGSRVDAGYDRDPGVFAALRATLTELFPALRDHAFTHAWGGPLGIPRDWHAGVGLDEGTGVAWAGGYVGDGVGTANLAGRTLADLVLRRDTDLTRLPWVGHRSRAWEPEPLRWLGVNAGLRVMSMADAEERITGRPSVIAARMAPLLGG